MKKATNAVARKLAIALYYMQSNSQEFTHEKYNLIKDTVVIDIPIDKLADLNHDFSRYVKPLKSPGVLTTAISFTNIILASFVMLKALVDIPMRRSRKTDVF